MAAKGRFVQIRSVDAREHVAQMQQVEGDKAQARVHPHKPAQLHLARPANVLLQRAQTRRSIEA